jgi:hypothetical protein
MPDELVEVISNTSRKSNCHNCRATILGAETKLKINYPHDNGFRYYYLCKPCATKLLNELNKRVI